MDERQVDGRAESASAAGGQGEAALSEETLHALREHADGPVKIYAASVQNRGAATYALARLGGEKNREKRLVVAGEEAGSGDPSNAFEEEASLETGGGKRVAVCALTPGNAKALHAAFPWTAPVPLGNASAVGCGDRLGMATPGHLRACRRAEARPVLAQQSIREMERTGRSPAEVLADATWGVFEAGFTGGYGADADHLKTEEHIDRCLAEGYTMYTIDPSDHVDNEADGLSGDPLEEPFQALPWEDLGSTPEEALRRYVEEPHEEAEALGVDFSEEELMRAAVKYGAAIAHTRRMADYLAARYETERSGEIYDLEMSVDETDHPTRPREHFFVAAELRRLGVAVTSLAPRFTGEFQKGIDFIGDLDAFEKSFARHAAIAEALGGYKLSIHSGSDKFSVYPIMGRHAGRRLHLKTAGTSYLEALRIPARHAPAVFREVVRYAFTRFETDKKTYHVTTDPDVIPAPADVADEELEETYLEKNDGRQLLHLTYGSVLTATGESGEPRFKDRFFALLDEHEAEHYEVLGAHFDRHLGGVGSVFANDRAPEQAEASA
jgi:hypothetical protein